MAHYEAVAAGPEKPLKTVLRFSGFQDRRAEARCEWEGRVSVNRREEFQTFEQSLRFT